jgi:hypothetical protein
MKTLLALAILAVAVVWTVEKFTGASLHVQLDALHQQKQDIDSLQRERERLQHLQPAAEERARLERAVAERDRLRRELATRKESSPTIPPTTLSLGEWLPPGSWKSRGQATPVAAVETAYGPRRAVTSHA